MDKYNYDLYCEQRKELGEYTAHSNLPLKVIYDIFKAFDSSMDEYYGLGITELKEKTLIKRR